MSDLEAYLQQLRASLDVTPARAEVIVSEARSHLEAKAAELEEAGLSRQEAVQAAVREFGDARRTGRLLTRANGRHRTFRRIRRGLLVCGLLLAASQWGLFRFVVFRTHLARGDWGIVARPAAARADRPDLASLPRFDASSPNSHQLQLQGRDLRALDLRERLPDLLQASFDSHTQWPAALPEAFNPMRVMHAGKSPGLGVRALHDKGITGRGVSIAIIDMSLLVDHAEYEERLRLYEELHSMERLASMHGTAVASIAVGKTVGVAPEADLYYIADSFCTSSPLPWASMLWQSLRASRDATASAATAKELNRSVMAMVDFRWAAKAIRRVLAINRRLPRERRIRAIAVEIGWSRGQTGYEAVTAAVEQAQREGVFVVSSCLSDTYGLRFHGLGREPMGAPEDPTSYHLFTDWGPGFDKPTLLFPMDSRTTAAPTGGRDYAFYRHGGWSWVTPYIAGLYALACQVKPDITPEVFWKTALETGTAPDYRAVPRVSRQSLKQKTAVQYDRAVAEARKRHGPKGVRRLLAATYREATGKPLPNVGEAELRERMIEVVTDRDTKRYSGREAAVVNPAGLIAALQE
jgi:hypothetical protein